MTSPPFHQFVIACGVALTPAQSVVVRVAFDGFDPCDLSGEDREIARQLFGDVERIPQSARSVIVAILGRGSGKTYLLALRLLFRAITADTDSLAPGEVGFALIIAPRLEDATQVLNFAIGAAEAVPSIASRIIGRTSTSIAIRNVSGRTIVVKAIPATEAGTAGRGKTIVEAGIDEACFLRDSDHIVNDKEVYSAIGPRLRPDGKIILISTPWSTAGLAYELFSTNREEPRTALTIHAATTLMRPDAATAALVARERERDPENASREFDADFFATGLRDALDRKAIEAAFAPLGGVSYSPLGDPWCALDPSGLTGRDRFASVQLRWMQRTYPPDAEYEREPRWIPSWYIGEPATDAGDGPLKFDERGRPIKKKNVPKPGPVLVVSSMRAIDASYRAGADVSAICDRLIREARANGCKWIASDPVQAAVIATSARRARANFVALNQSPAEKAAALVRFKTLMDSQMVVIDPRDPLSSQLKRDLLGITQRISAGGLSSYKLARGANGHGDLAAALLSGVQFEITQPDRERPPITAAQGSPLRDRSRDFDSEFEGVPRGVRSVLMDW